MRTILKAYTSEFILIAILLFLVVGLFIMNPLLTAFNIDFIQNYQGDTQYGIILFTATFIANALLKLSFAQLMYRYNFIGINMKNSLNMMIYCKSLRYSSTANKQFSEAEILNYS